MARRALSVRVDDHGSSDRFPPVQTRAALAPLGRALADYTRGVREAVVTVHSEDGPPDVLPAAHFFREVHSPLERMALDRCSGRVLDLGAGAGAHALVLQERGCSVTAVDLLPEAVQIMEARGVADARMASWTDPDRILGPPYDTVLSLMNGTGVAGTVAGLRALLSRVDILLAQRGRFLVDSTDLREDAEVDVDGTGGDGRYPGEVHLQLEYEGRRGDPFPHLFVDPDTFRDLARNGGFAFRIVGRADEGAYLAELTRRREA